MQMIFSCKRLQCLAFTILFICIISFAGCELAAWDCPECGRTGNTDNYCGGCGYQAPRKDGVEEAELDSSPGKEITYQAEKETNFSIIRVTAAIQNGKITDCRIVSKAKMEGSDFLTDEICMAWEKSIIKNQTAETDTITGATLQFSSAAVREAVEDILAQAKSAESTQKVSDITDLSEQLAAAEARIAELTKQLEEATAANNTNGNAKKQLAAGDIITFGHYEQDDNIANGKEKIEWIVLDYNEKEHKALLLSKYGLDVQRYNNDNSGVTWETSTIRGWLNKEFYQEAFDKKEQSVIQSTSVNNNQNQGYSGWNSRGGKNTWDKIFLLSYMEANRYLGVTIGIDNVAARISATTYVLQRGAYQNSNYKTEDGDAAWWWWLRSPGIDQFSAASVDYDGSLDRYSIYFGNGCVRPALWVNLESDLF